jgi:hypothetical protein
MLTHVCYFRRRLLGNEVEVASRLKDIKAFMTDAGLEFFESSGS